MANYEINLNPNLVNIDTEGSMDTSLLNGKSIQRTVTGLEIVNNNNRKIVGRLSDGESFDNIVAGVSTGVFILINTNYVDYQENTTGTSHEANNVMAIMDQASISYQTFTDISEGFFGSLSSSSKILIPEIEEDNLNPDLTSGARSALNNFVNNGGTLIMFNPGNGDVLTVLNETFGFTLQEGNVNTPINITSSGEELFPDEAGSLPSLSATNSIDSSTLPEDSVVLYEGDEANESVVTLINYGNGKIYVLGWDFYDAPPLGGENENGWNSLLEAIIAE